MKPLATTPVRDLMTTEITRIQVDASIHDVARLMYEQRLSCLLVDDDTKTEDCKTVGIVTERDLTRTLSLVLEGRNTEGLRDVMTTSLITIRDDTDYSEAIRVLKENSIRRIIVVCDTGRVCGLITRADLLNAQKRILENEVLQRTQELEETNKILEELSVTDPMLNVGNRRAMDKALKDVFNYTKRYARPYSIVLLDIDRFKCYNDFYGHQLGDQALIKVATELKAIIRNTDSIYRYGGEEFLVLLPETGLAGAMIAGEHMREAVESIGIPHEKSPFDIVTASFGVASINITEPDQKKTITEADEALYVAKSNGRNRVESLDAKNA